MGAGCSSPSGRTGLVTQLVTCGDLRDVASLVQAEPRVVYKSVKRSGSLLHIAAEHGRTAVLQLLLHHAEELLSQPYAKQRAAAAASSGGSGTSGSRRRALTKLIDSRNERSQTPLMLAAEHGHVQCVQVLLDMGADRWACDCLGGRTALHYAARSNNALLLSLLLEGAPAAPSGIHFPNNAATRYVDARTITGLTPLQFAVREGGLEAAALLLRAGAQLTACTLFDGEWLDCARGTSPLHVAARLGNQDMAMLLLQAYAERSAASRGLDPRHVKDADQLLPCDVAALRGHTQLATLLDPLQRLSGALRGSALLLVGPPRLSCLAAGALRSKLQDALAAAVAKAAAAEEEEGPRHPARPPARVASGGSGGQQECPICLEALPLAAHRCVALSPCGHRLCLPCAGQLHERQGGDLMRCPLCRGAVADLHGSSGGGGGAACVAGPLPAAP